MRHLLRFSRLLNHHVTFLVIPHADLPQLRGRFSMAFVLFGVLLWTGLTVWAGFAAGRQLDYWVTKADNMVMGAKMSYMAQEIDRSREVLETARATDKQLRILLGMRSRDEILKSEEGLGGPNASDRAGLASLVSSGRLSQSDVRRTVLGLRSESQRRLASFQEIAWYITNERSLSLATPEIWPTSGHITSPYGYRFSPFGGEGSGLHANTFHEGVDIANKPDTPIFAAADGVVRYAGWSSGFGVMVLVDHGFSYSTLYGHTSKVAVKVGDRVTRGQLIAYMGTTGRSTGNHLHYEVWRQGRPVNPLSFLRVQPGGEGT
ncbi:MAG: M23 family metallopeptidase [Elusimicrobia bacterium]|nr:M23 family metallopeptidase [Elusimicrobiota bacterium]